MPLHLTNLTNYLPEFYYWDGMFTFLWEICVKSPKYPNDNGYSCPWWNQPVLLFCSVACPWDTVPKLWNSLPQKTQGFWKYMHFWLKLIHMIEKTLGVFRGGVFRKGLPLKLPRFHLLTSLAPKWDVCVTPTNRWALQSNTNSRAAPSLLVANKPKLNAKNDLLK